jgi:GT2 family glycosyltransferase
MKVTIAIPNYNGKSLLEKNLPNILKSGAEEVLIIDDGSVDDSVKLLEKIKVQEPTVKLMVNEKNLGFIPTVNKLFDLAKGEIVVLLNNDVFVERDFLNPLLKHFEKREIFAVNCHEGGEGPAVAFWKNGFFEYKRGEEKMKVQKSAWASGGSAAYSKAIWQTLGGFDDLYAPFYFEDTDISFRALEQGYQILWEPKSKVKHVHETTISKTFSKRYINWITQRNLLLFIWKNIREKRLVREHQKALFKRLLNPLRLGYWIPFLWALSMLPLQKVTKDQKITDLEAINYANN